MKRGRESDSRLIRPSSLHASLLFGMKESLGATIKSQIGVVRVVVGFAGTVVAAPINYQWSVGAVKKNLELTIP